MSDLNYPADFVQLVLNISEEAEREKNAKRERKTFENEVKTGLLTHERNMLRGQGQPLVNSSASKSTPIHLLEKSNTTFVSEITVKEAN